MRTTIDIEPPLLEEIKRLQRAEGLPMGQLVSALLAEALAARRRGTQPATFAWNSKSMSPLVDLADKGALDAALDE